MPKVAFQFVSDGVSDLGIGRVWVQEIEIELIEFRLSCNEVGGHSCLSVGFLDHGGVLTP